MLGTIALIVVIVSNTLLGLFVLSRDFRKKTNLLFVILTFLLVAWVSLNFSVDYLKTEYAQLLASRFSFAVGFTLIFAVWLFTMHFPQRLQNRKIQRTFAKLITPIIVGITAATPYIAEGVVRREEAQITDVITGPLYGLYILSALIFLFFVATNIYASYHTKGTSTASRQQIIYVAAGILITFVWSMITTTIWPLISGNWEVAQLGIVGTLFLTGFIAVAIVKHKLFDIRLIVARTVGYILSISAIGILYGAIIFGASSTILGNTSFSALQRLFFVVSALFIAFTFQPIKRFFDRISNKFFYQDAYDLQAYLNEFNTLLVSSIDLNKISKDSVDTIQKYLKPEYVALYIDKSGELAAKMTTSTTTKLDIDDVEKLKPAFAPLKSAVITTDELANQDADLRAKLNEHEISLVVRITPNDKNSSVLGYIIIGPKKSGSIYNKQDIRAMKIIANELVIAIQNALRFEEIQQFNVTLQEKIDTATHQLRKANEKLKALDETKDEFISMASHQLRTPLTTVKGYVSMVLEGDAGKISKDQAKLLDQSYLSAQRMVYLIADLLNVSRLRTGKFVIDATPTNLADLVEGEIEQLKETARARNLELTYNKPKDFPVLMLDDTKIRQVVMNFADNAIYYTPAGGHIKINLEDKGESVEFTVVDDGIGVPKHVQHHLFGKFYRADNAKKARPDGTGLGLFMAQKVVVAQGGAIVFHSEEGKGSTFGFSFSKSKLKVPDHLKTDAKKVSEHSKEPSLL